MRVWGVAKGEVGMVGARPGDGKYVGFGERGRGGMGGSGGKVWRVAVWVRYIGARGQMCAYAQRRLSQAVL